MEGLPCLQALGHGFIRGRACVGTGLSLPSMVRPAEKHMMLPPSCQAGSADPEAHTQDAVVPLPVHSVPPEMSL